MADLEDIEDAGHHDDDETIFTNCRNNLLESFAIASKPQQSEDDHSILGRENMKIYLRIRPFSDKEIKDGENQHCLERENEHMVIMHAPKDSVTYKNSMHGCGKVAHKFTFSKTFPDMTSQKEFFNVTMLGKVKDFVDGQNCLLFTYGVTNSGKTYTIQGNPKDAGILPRTLDVLFNSIQGRQWGGMSLKPRMFSDIVKLSTRQEAAEQKVKDSVMKLATDDDIDVTSLLGDDAASDVSRLSTISTVSTATASSDDQPMITNEDEAKENIVKLFEEAENREREEAAISVEAQGQIKFSVWVSFAEVYNEYIYDLLEAIPSKKNEKNFRRTTLKLSEDKNGSPYIKGLKHIHVTSADEAYKVLTIGQKNLSVACTKLNHSSSRSHCIFNIKLLRVVDKDDPHVARISQLSFCDLAGSERYGKTKADGERLKEAGNINTSLLTLGRCLAVLRHNQAHPKDTKIIPFRDSKLTRLFQSYFSGKGKASMIVNINQCATMFDETLHVCKFSAIAKQIKVEQEVEKVRPKPRAKGITMALNQSSRVRPSIAWATPGTMAQYTEEAANIPLPEEDEDEDLDDDEEEDADNVQGNQKLIELLQSLKNQLVEEKRKNMNLEVEIRNEVCQEMADQLVEIENSYSDRLREEQMLIEEKAEKRIEMYTQSVKKSRKRARVVEDDEDEYVSSIHLHAEKVKVQEAEKHNSELQTQLSSVRADLSQTREQLQQAEAERKKAQDLVAELQSKLDNAQSASDSENTVTQVRNQIEVLETGKARQAKELTAAYEAIKDLKATLKESRGNQQEDESQISNNELIKNLTRELTEAKEQLQAQITENAELQETLNEAGETFQQKESEISKLQTVIAEGEKSIEEQASALTELQKLVEELRAGVEEAHEKISQKDTQIGTLEQQLAESKDALSKEGTVQQSHLSDLTSTISQANQKLENLQVEVTEKDAKIAELDSSLEQKYKEVENVEAELVKERASLLEAKAYSTQLEQQITQGTTDIESLKASLKDRDGTISQLQAKIAGLETSLEMASENGETLVKNNSEISDLKSELSMKEKAQKELEMKLSEMQTSVKELKDSLEQTETSLQDQYKDYVQLEEKCEAMKAGKEELEAKLGEVEKERDQTQEKLKHTEEKARRYTDTSQDLKDELSAMKEKTESLEQTVKVLSHDLDEANEEITKKKIGESNLEIVIGKKEQSIAALETQLAELKQQYQQELAAYSDAKSNMSVLETEAFRVQELMVDRDSQVQELQARIKELEAETNKAETQQSETATHNADTMKELELKLSSVTEEAANAAEEMETKLQNIESELQNEQKLHKECRNNVKRLENRITQLEDLSNNGTTSNKLDDSLKYELDQLRDELEKEKIEKHRYCNTIDELHSKVNGLEMSLEMANENLSLVEELNVTIGDLEHKLHTEVQYKEEVEDKASKFEVNVKSLQTELKTAQEKADTAAEKVTQLEDILDNLSDKCRRLEKQNVQLETDLNKLNDADSELKKDLASSENDTKEKVNELESKIAVVNEQLKSTLEEYAQKTNELKDKSAKLTSLTNELNDARDSEQNRITELSQCKVKEKELKSKINQLESDLEMQSQLKLEALNNIEKNSEDYKTSLANLESQISTLKESENSLNQQIADFVVKCKALKDELNKKETNAIELENTLETDLSLKNNKLQELQTTIEDKQVKITDLESAIKSVQLELTNRDETIQKLKDGLKSKDSVLAKRDAKIVDLEEVVKTKQDAEKAVVEDSSHEIETLKVKVRELESKIAEETNRTKEMSSALAEKQKYLDDLSHDLDTRESSIDAYNKQISLLKNETTLLQEQVDKTQERESNLRGQLQEASQKLEEQHKQLNELEDKLSESEKAKRSLDERNTQLKETISSSKLEAESNSGKYKELEEEHNSVKKQLADLERLLAKKEERIKTKNTTITDLMTKIDGECSKYELALKDHKSNEMLINQLRGAMEEMEKTAQLQEDVLNQRDEEISKITKELGELNERHMSLQQNTMESSKRIKETEVQLKAAQVSKTDMSSVQAQLEAQVKTLQGTITKLEHDKSILHRDMTDTNNELKELEKLLSESRREIENLKLQTKEDHKQILQSENKEKDTIKLKITSLITQNKEKDDQINKLEDDLNTFRHDRDKLVQGLEQIMKKKDAEIEKLKSASQTGSADTDSESSLAEQLREKDDIIQALQSELEKAPSRRGRSRRNVPSVSETEETELLAKQLQDKCKELKDCKILLERTQIAKDEVISDLKEANKKLQDEITSVPEIDVQTSQQPVVPVQKKRGGTRAKRNRKTSSDTDTQGIENQPVSSEKPTRASTRAGRPSTNRRRKTRTDENSFFAIQEESVDVIDLDTPPTSAQKKRNVDELVQVNLSGEHSPTACSQPLVAPNTTEKKRRRRLMATDLNKPFDQSPNSEMSSMAEAEDPHKIVTRRLRSRRQ
ncbi:unnamed protein product [Owenia fusiformis]|uniref:Uncharacterized protein n=1 Tax=Owenia fusiformis TaxID=6347 RepID=A0A8J1T649_OWEFU|nr:unnamed protein product [Owenia fusiformis]